MVNRGYVARSAGPDELRAPPDRRPVESSACCAGRSRAAGSLRRTMTARKDLWFVRDHRRSPQAKGWADVAPFYIDLEAPPAPGGLPQARSAKVSLPTTTCNMPSPGTGWRCVFLISAGVLRARAAARDGVINH